MFSARTRFGVLLSLLTVGCWILSGCGRQTTIIPAETTLSSPEIQPLLAAMRQVDRTNLGFTPLTTNAHLTLELHPLGEPYDAMLHAYGETSRDIAFRKTPSGYRWIFEQETTEGPGWMQTVDGTFHERLTIKYQTEPLYGWRTNQIEIHYVGMNADLQNHQLNLSETRLILEKWKVSPVQPKPPDLPGSDFPDPLPALLVLIACATVLLIAGLILVIAVLCAIAVIILLLAGILSTSVLVAYFRHSFSAGFRSLLIQFSALGGILCGALATAIIIAIRHASWNSPLYWIIGPGFGLIVGTLFGWALSVLLNRLGRALSKKLAA